MPRTKQFNEEEVLNKAVEVFWKKGFHDTSMQDLVDCLGINRASMYHTYGDKKQLFLSAFKLYTEAGANELKRFLGNYPDPREGFRKMLEARISDNFSDRDRKGCFAVNTTTELVPGDKDVEELLLKNTERIEGIFHDYLQSGEQEGFITPGKDLKAIASLIYIISSGIQVVSKVKGDDTSLVAATKSVISLLD